MPSVSGKQHRAMEAAAHGKSILGIPKKVGKDFAAADEEGAKHEKAESPKKESAEEKATSGKTFKTMAMANALRKKKMMPMGGMEE